MNMFLSNKKERIICNIGPKANGQFRNKSLAFQDSTHLVGDAPGQEMKATLLLFFFF